MRNLPAMGSDPAGLTPWHNLAIGPSQPDLPGDSLTTACFVQRGSHAEAAGLPRSPRQDHEGAWQHVMNRGIGRQAVFRGDDDRQIFSDCLAAAMPRYGIEVHAWCLLDNHFHLLP
jgi:hypothetical protein